MPGRIVFELSDFGLEHFEGAQVIFTPSGPGVKGLRLFAASPVVVTPNVNGAAAVVLESTDGVVPEVWYQVSIKALQPGGQFHHFDILGFKLYVPEGYDGSIDALPGTPLSPQNVLVSLDTPPPSYKGWWLYSPAIGQTMPLDDPLIGELRMVS